MHMDLNIDQLLQSLNELKIASEKIPKLEKQIETLETALELSKGKSRFTKTVRALEEKIIDQNSQIEVLKSELLELSNRTHDRDQLYEALSNANNELHLLRKIVDDDEKHAKIEEIESWLISISKKLGIKLEGRSTTSLLSAIYDEIRKKF